MIYVLLGAFAYPVLTLHDLAVHNHKKKTGWLLFALGCAMLIYSYVMIWLTPEVWFVPAVLRWVGAGFAGVFFVLLVFSLMVEIPFSVIYLSDRHGVSVVDTGTYALCRHPGVLWLFLLLAFTFAAGGRPLQLATLAVWSTTDTLYAWIQEKYFYPKVFGGAYEEYKSRVPMVIPRWSGVRRCCRTILRRS